MCLTAFILPSTSDESGYRFVLAFNRDEFYSKPAKPASFWQNNSAIISGLDMTSTKPGHTWLAMSKTGRLALLLNVCPPGGIVDSAGKRRGSLVKNFAEGSSSCEEYLKEVALKENMYRGFNLVTADLIKNEVFYYSNKSKDPPRRLQIGAHGISNSVLESPWTKTTYTKEMLASVMTNSARKSKETLTEEILSLMKNDKPLNDDNDLIKETDLTLEALTPLLPELVYVKSSACGTRSQTVILIDAEDEVMYTERYLKEPIDVRNPKSETITLNFKLVQDGE